ncbi:MAG TPA: class I SAM-dependent methyltransferase [Jatrophihabitans sp.]|jgi:SAM-dependent methyltransferase|uniref:class I SAM-dependent methyltransferase n=1 Tax=Jatrophihabitans sp. TaxID=1932789 RepID=UPI002F225124
MSSEHESAIGEFYSEFPYPWRVTRLARVADASLYPALLSQELGDYRHRRLPKDASIWVPGCGVNQALIIALQYPDASVIGSDVSEESLRLCSAAAAQVGAENLTLRREGLTEVDHDAMFDYIVCTGVIHHNPDPSALLKRIGAALKPTGVLELMVYNEFHRREITAFQEAMRLIGRDQDLFYAKRFARSIDADSSLICQLRAEIDEPDMQFADTWLNPCEKTFTVQGLSTLAATAGLTLEAPCLSQVGKAADAYTWELSLTDERIRKHVDSLDDVLRWQLSNLLLTDRSPLLWFYARRSDNPIPALTERERDEAFLDTVLKPVSTTERVWLLQKSGGYRELDQSAVVPARSVPDYADLVAAIDGERPMREIYLQLGELPGPRELRRTRIELTTPASPYLVAMT